MYFIYYILNFTSNVPIVDSLLMFFQYYVAFILIFGLVLYLISRFFIKPVLVNILVIPTAHLLFIFLLFHSLMNLDSGSFFDRAP